MGRNHARPAPLRSVSDIAAPSIRGQMTWIDDLIDSLFSVLHRCHNRIVFLGGSSSFQFQCLLSPLLFLRGAWSKSELACDLVQGSPTHLESCKLSRLLSFSVLVLGLWSSDLQTCLPPTDTKLQVWLWNYDKNVGSIVPSTYPPQPYRLTTYSRVLLGGTTRAGLCVLGPDRLYLLLPTSAIPRYDRTAGSSTTTADRI
ncbi:hypothetical protein BKA82DRAFT_291807 [Pisolithus tinctorius]|uniref:Uncharacterized protein n=1 Tax=Pisolithus tinctorius Marx 270 TaxID=870435 RepID=A0A0C3IGB1_PISTI|nr:hypothetical protein BKA82DRAFT_291807 [Pisolithus tinctorius]KIN96077.1 hypothetical protein M404DRAFT_291807 [Pisolithus tinctorius Marx 270]